ncbi:MAG: hypothetical protein H6811_01855 [Phycisphaeraceae bacterium]|nr:hypothetical protein [Phycisphaeraceae bacterium]
MADRIKEAFGIEATLTPGESGAFDVSLDGQMVYTNKERRGFIPEPEHVLGLLRPKLG